MTNRRSPSATLRGLVELMLRCVRAVLAANGEKHNIRHAVIMLCLISALPGIHLNQVITHIYTKKADVSDISKIRLIYHAGLSCQEVQWSVLWLNYRNTPNLISNTHSEHTS